MVLFILKTSPGRIHPELPSETSYLTSLKLLLACNISQVNTITYMEKLRLIFCSKASPIRIVLVCIGE